MSDKRKVIVELECGKVTCGECEKRADYYCDLWEVNLTEDAEDIFLRCPECLAAEAKADDMMLKVACAKAAPQGL